MIHTQIIGVVFWIVTILCTVAFLNRLRKWVNFPNDVQEVTIYSRENNLRRMSLIILSIPVIIGFTVELPEARGWGSIMAWADNYELHTIIIGICGLSVMWKSYEWDEYIKAEETKRFKGLVKEQVKTLKQISKMRGRSRALGKSLEMIEQDSQKIQLELDEAESKHRSVVSKESKLTTVLSGLKDSLAELVSSTKMKEERVPEIESKIESVTDEKRLWEVLEADVSKKLKKLEVELATVESKSIQLVESVKQSKTKDAELKKKMKTHSNNIDKMSKELGALNKEIEKNQPRAEGKEQLESEVEEELERVRGVLDKQEQSLASLVKDEDELRKLVEEAKTNTEALKAAREKSREDGDNERALFE